MNSTVRISIRELHAHTGHYVRKATEDRRVVITDHGKAVAELVPSGSGFTNGVNPWTTRELRPEFDRAMRRGAFRPRPGDRDIMNLISDDREGR